MIDPQQVIISQLLPNTIITESEKTLITNVLINLLSLEILDLATEKLSSRDLYLFMGATSIDSSALLLMLADRVPDLKEELIKRVKIRLEKSRR